MPRRKKNVEIISSEEVKTEAPKVETTIIVGKQEIPDNKEEQQKDIVDDIIDNSGNLILDDQTKKSLKNKLFEPSKTKSISIDKIIMKKPDRKRIGQIKTNLTQRPIISSYKGSRTRKSRNFSISFKVGG